MPDRSTAPALQHTLELTLPPSSVFLNRPELEGLLIPSDRQQVVNLELVFKAGTIHEPATGVSGFAVGMLDKGTTGKSAAEVAGLLDFYSAHLNLQAGNDFCTLSLYCLTRNFKFILPLLSEILTSPSFDEEEFRVVRDIYVQNLSVNMEKNSYVAGLNIRKLVYGDHTYGQHVTREHAEAVTTGQLREFFNGYFRPWKVFVAGAVEPADLETLMAMLPQVGPAREGELPKPIFAGPTSLHTEKEGAVQCSIRMGKPCIDRSASDYPALLMANHILGGYFGSRLMRNIREEKGLTYGIYSSMQHLMYGGMLVIGADVNKEKLEPALEAIRLELAGMSEIPEQELAIARNHFIGSLQNDLNTIFAGAERIRTIRLNNLPPDYYSTLIQSIDKLSAKSIADAAARYFTPDSFAVAIAG
ncbi:MAG: M16 family metallopeptidase [Bacteroidota bacterium]